MSMQTWAENAKHRRNEELTLPEIFLLCGAGATIDGERLGELGLAVIDKLAGDVNDNSYDAAQVLTFALMRILDIGADSLRRLGGDA